MSEMKPMPGPWAVTFEIDEGGAFAVVSDAGINVALTIGGTKSEEANARLIAEAGTVFHECGLSPRQLVEMNAELVEALKSIDTRLRICMGGTISASDAYDTFYQGLVKDALTKANASSISKGVE